VERIRWYEAAALANAILVVALIVRRAGFPLDVAATVRAEMPMFLVAAGLLFAGAGLRALLGAAGDGRARARLYLRRISARTVLADFVRFAAVVALVSYGYSWLKVFVPRLHPSIFDPALAVLDQKLHLGVNPVRFAVEVFPFPAFWRALDVYYAAFFATILFGIGWFGSALSRRERTRFAAGFSVLWIAGAWLYLAVPALGPCFVFPGDAAAAQPFLPLQANTQRLLLAQYRAVTGRVEPGHPLVINSAFGIAAMPSLHVGAQAFIAFFARRRAPRLAFVFGLLAALTFFGSLVTGWHYAVDGYAGVLLAWLAHRAGLRSA
jgi:TRAP-type C4-dicarboxylate transport system permease small subunit